MLDIGLLGLVGAGLLAGVLLFDNDDDDDDDDHTAQKVDWQGEQDVETGDGDDVLTALAANADGDTPEINEIDMNGGNDAATVEVSVGEIDMGDGNDTLTFANDEVFLSFDRIEMDDGDDVVIVDGGSGGTLDGGAGDDSIYAMGTMDVQGGLGNDTITGILLGSAHGGVGDDVLSVDRPFGTGDSAHMLGGVGNDTLQAVATLGDTEHPYDEGPWIQMTGGEGADSFEVAVTLGEMTQAEYDMLAVNGHVPNEESLPFIQDFDPAEDSITVEIDTTGATVDREVIVSDFEQKPYTNGGYVTTVEFHVPAQGGMVEGTTTLTIYSLVTFDIADLNITVDGNPLTYAGSFHGAAPPVLPGAVARKAIN